MILFCTGAGLCTLAYFLGVGAVHRRGLHGRRSRHRRRRFARRDRLWGSRSLSAFVLMLIGGVWMVGQVIADQSGGALPKR
jgi:hypothetical protein